MIGTPGIRWCDCRWRFLVNGPISPLNRPLFKFIHFCVRADTLTGLQVAAPLAQQEGIPAEEVSLGTGLPIGSSIMHNRVIGICIVRARRRP